MTDDDPSRDATAMLGLLKSDEEKLEEQTKVLVKNRKDYARRVFSTNVDNWTPFHAFALKGCRKLVKFALKVGVDVNLQMGEPEGVPGKCSALHLAAHRGDVSIIEVLLQNGANINQLDSSDKTPIYYASISNNTLAVKTLKRAAADTSQVEDDALPQRTRSGANPFNLVLPFICTGKQSSFT
jgi:ankyrin repeat protein